MTLFCLLFQSSLQLGLISAYGQRYLQMFSTTHLMSLSIHIVHAQLALVVLLVTGIHFIEAYGLNPAIYSAHLKLHPLLVLSVLVIAEHSLGVWGLLLAGASRLLYLMLDVPSYFNWAACTPVSTMLLLLCSFAIASA